MARAVLILWLCIAGAVRADEHLSSIRLFVAGKAIEIPDSTQEKLRQGLLQLVQSSNFHSGTDDKSHSFDFESVQQDYRDAVSFGGQD
jgi:hypothetical protein